MEWAGLFAIVGLWLYACKWRRTVLERLFRYALASDREEDREELAGRAVMAGSRSARLLYALNSQELFDKARPIRPFLFGKIPCIFADYYFAQRYEDWLRTEQADFSVANCAYQIEIEAEVLQKHMFFQKEEYKGTVYVAGSY